ncbi:MAG TPA: NAD(P) transhydrogenase subunit alpha, partial [Myxococcota bacterium]|nr:NAD(P) transhydrogenase subunit alpha [Myxococcota bacterium]
VVAGAAELWSSVDLVLKIQPPSASEVEQLREGALVVAILQPFQNGDTVRRLAAKRATSFSLDLLPRITRAQSMDVLSSMSTIAGYKGVLLAAAALPRLVPLLMTAAGTLKAARFLILGVGVAGLQAIATAKRLGAVVEAFDIRPAVKEQVESLGARFVAHEAIQAGGEAKGGYAAELTPEQQARQRELLSKHIADADAVVCSALVPGRRAPILLSRAQVGAMRPGSVVVDLAADQGGNCELTRPGETVEHGGVKILAPLNLPSSVSLHASQMLSRNFQNFLLHLLKKGELQLDLADEISAGTLVTRGGEIAHAAVRSALSA